ncbi:hypothetical protein JIX56_25545 [Streptomyces sp. CA-210063]|uniref:hypothetical protein n=1 Tax=Streptomyces sp. CA-210063 TaxID=2801029 RepID=UPI00214BBF27|nr:hypothetical protein [Streptomyces sp. CA-210063]UUU32968.1 hypothetical protein JIX56_25545 [Streptomyces sp. CA-210063]
MKEKGIRRGAYRSALWRALIVPAATVIAVPALATSAQATHQRTVTGSASFRIMDYEDFGSNTVCNRNVSLTPRVITVGTPRSFVVQATCGGEIRVEVHYKLTHQQGGFIRVTEGVVKLFEGDSENTGDLDGASAFANIFLYPGQSASRAIHVQNWNEGQPDDKADVTLTLRN